MLSAEISLGFPDMLSTLDAISPSSLVEYMNLMLFYQLGHLK